MSFDNYVFVYMYVNIVFFVMLFSSLAACLRTRNTVWCLVPINYFLLVIVKLNNINLYRLQCMKIRLNKVLDFRYDPDLKDKKKKKMMEFDIFLSPY